MTAPVRQTGQSVSVFSLGGTAYLQDLDNCTVTVQVKDEDASGIADAWEYAWATKQSVQIESDMFVAHTNYIMPLVGTSLAVSYNSGAGTYAGQFLLTMDAHSATKTELQKNKFTLKGQGALTFTPNS